MHFLYIELVGRRLLARDFKATPLRAPRLSMVSGQRFHAGLECPSHSDRTTCRLKRRTPQARAHPAPDAWQGGRTQNFNAIPLRATALFMASGQRF